MNTWIPILAAAVLVGACSSTSPKCRGECSSGHTGTGPTGTRADAAPAAPDDDKPLTREECMELLDHFIDVTIAEMKNSLPPERIPTEEQIEKIRRSELEGGMQDCAGEHRSTFECSMAAQSRAEIARCQCRAAHRDEGAVEGCAECILRAKAPDQMAGCLAGPAADSP